MIHSARVVAYALVEDMPYRKWGRLIVGDQLVEKVPRLAIAHNLGKDIGPLLFHCDESWNCLGTSGGATIEDVKAKAEQNYPGVDSRWVDTGYTLEQALAFFDEQTGGLRCSFCGRRPFELERMVSNDQAAICNYCVDEFFAELRDNGVAN